MHNVLLKFTFEGPAEINEEPPTWLLSGFYQNGQLVDYFHTPVIKDNTHIYSGLIIQKDALDSRYYTPTTIKRLQDFKDQFHIKFDYEIIGQTPANTVTELKDVSAFILTAGGASPVRSIDTFFNVPLYLLPKTSVCGENYYNIVSWGGNYEAMERLWFKGNVDEQYFYDQLTNYKSSLSQYTRELCQLIASRTNKDCYFHLFRDHNPDIAAIENCPGCNAPWKLEGEIFDTFKYKCNNCCIIS